MIKNAKIIGTQVDPEIYHHRDSSIPRGNPQYVMSRGELVEFAHCPHRWINGYKEDDEPKDSQEWGSLIDTLLLDPLRFSEKYSVAPATYMAEGKKKGDPPIEKPWNWNATACKEWRDSQNGKSVIKAEEETEAVKAVLLLKNDPIVSEVLFCSDKQVMVTADYEDEETGIIVPLRTLIDIAPSKDYADYAKCLIDLKTCCLADPGAWTRAVFQHKYHVQSALYLDTYNAATGENRRDFRHIVQESFPPYEIAKRILSEEYIKLGREKYQDALRLYAMCIKENHWPDYDELQNYHINGWGIVDPESWMI